MLHKCFYNRLTPLHKKNFVFCSIRNIITVQISGTFYIFLITPYYPFHKDAPFISLTFSSICYSICCRIKENLLANICFFKADNKNNRKRCEICSNLTIKTTSLTSFWCFIVNFRHILHLFLVFLKLTLNKQMLTGFVIK